MLLSYIDLEFYEEFTGGLSIATPLFTELSQDASRYIDLHTLNRLSGIETLEAVPAEVKNATAALVRFAASTPDAFLTSEGNDGVSQSFDLAVLEFKKEQLLISWLGASSPLLHRGLP